MHRTAAVFVFAWVAAAPVFAASPTLERIADSGVFRIGYVPDAPPLSFTDASGKATGYSIDLCRYIAAAVKESLDLDTLHLEFVPLNAMEERLEAVESGRVDIECGATTVTLSRRERVDFTLMTFITGVAILSHQAAPIDSLDELGEKPIAVVRGTTTEAVLREFARVNEIRVKLSFADTHDEGVRLLDDGKVVGYASDRAMLIGQIFRDAARADRYRMTKRALSFEPYAMMTLRGDTEFRLVADRALAAVYRRARIRRLYQTWFGRYGESLSPVVAAMYRFQAVSE